MFPAITISSRLFSALICKLPLLLAKQSFHWQYYQCTNTSVVPMAILLLRSMSLSEKPGPYFKHGLIKFNALQHYQQFLSKQSPRCPG